MTNCDGEFEKWWQERGPMTFPAAHGVIARAAFEAGRAAERERWKHSTVAVIQVRGSLRRYLLMPDGTSDADLRAALKEGEEVNMCVSLSGFLGSRFDVLIPDCEEEAK